MVCPFSSVNIALFPPGATSLTNGEVCETFAICCSGCFLKKKYPRERSKITEAAAAHHFTLNERKIAFGFWSSSLSIAASVVFKNSLTFPSAGKSSLNSMDSKTIFARAISPAFAGLSEINVDQKRFVFSSG